MWLEEIEKYYSGEVNEAIWEVSKDREVGATKISGKYYARPCIINYPGDIKSFVEKGAVSFHGSVERWSQPMRLSTDLSKKDLDRLRIGWDLVIDLDCSELEYAKIGTEVLVDFLKKNGIKDISIKYSGNRGFHIGVPFEVFPKEYGQEIADGSWRPVYTKNKYPEYPKRIAEYLKDGCWGEMKKRMKKYIGEEDPYKYIEFDTGIFSSRHLFRLPYSLHAKTWLVSVPLKESEIGKFEKEMAKPENVEVREKFLKRDVKSDGRKLMGNALAWSEIEETIPADFKPLSKPVKTDFFPPCIKNILKGLEDGRKRSVFVLVTFLLNLGWGKEDVERLLLEWNRRNREPLKKNLLLYTLRDQLRKGRPMLPPSCNSENYYQSYGVCSPDRLCKNIKNPLGYVLVKRKKKK